MTVLTPPTLGLLKVSFFILYLQLFAPMRWFRICNWIGIVLTILFYTSMCISQIIFSTPTANETWFSHQVTEGQKHLSISVPITAVGFGIDISILVLPIFAVSKLQMRTKRKIGVMLIFMTGLL